MPIYEYKCDNCGAIIETTIQYKDFEKYKDDAPCCDKCNSIFVFRIYRKAPAVIYKGTGFTKLVEEQ